MQVRKSLAAGLFVAALSIGSLQATPITPGGSIAAGSLATVGSIFGGTLLGQIDGNFVSAIPGHYSGRYSASVYRTATNTLDFVYSFISTSGNEAIQSVTMGSFAGFTTDLYVVDTVAGINPATLSGNAATRSVDGKNVKFIYDTTGVSAGQTADTLVIRTNATTYTNGSFTFQNGSTATVAAYAPVPEPATLGLIGVGLAALGFSRRRRS